MSDRCFICGEDNPTVLQEHHILPRRHGGGDSEDNLVTLCANCHEAVEKMYDDGFYEKAGYATPGVCDTVSAGRATEIVDRFLDECDDVVMRGGIAKRALYDRFKEWAAGHPEADVPAANIFGKALLSAGDGVGSAQRRIDGGRVRVYTGITLLSNE